MTLLQIAVFTAAAILFRLITRERWRGWILLGMSVLAIYWLQPATPIRHLDFWFPTATLIVTLLVWFVTRDTTQIDRKETGIAAGIIAGLIILIGLSRYFQPLCCIIPTRPPVLTGIGIALAATFVLAFLLRQSGAQKTWPLILGTLVLLALFLILKTEPVGTAVSAWLRTIAGQDSSLAAFGDLRWLGFSYVAFRLLHTLRDRMLGRLPALSLQEMVNYVIFFPAFVAGPIDRAERFVKNLRQPLPPFPPDLVEGSRRIVTGIFLKFVLADALALVALNPANAVQTTVHGWLWLYLYAYALRIYFDFSGYTDVAIGLGRVLGIKLPENFDRPYLKPNLTMFWNSWHMTLAQWFRTYFFNPLTRALRSGKKKLSPGIIIFLTQLSTMILIGLWHGVTWNFFIWGAWHGLGLFVHNRWADFARSHLPQIPENHWSKLPLRWLGIFLNFQFVSLGWVWFALPDFSVSWQVFAHLFGA